MGTSGKNNLTKAAMPLLDVIGALKGERHRSGLIYSLAFGNYTKRYKKGSNRLSWMSQDPLVLSAFIEDPKCDFILTVAGFRDLMSVLTFVSRKEWAKEVPKSLPIHLLSGDMDPVGDYGKGVQQVYKSLLNAKVTDLTMKLYPGVRHELLNEPSKETVSQDIIEWLEIHL
jgi:alpha-beta hydrolase superfamily lysophospholipase